MKICISLQSMSDIITNSSSEIFTVKNVDNIKELKKLIKEIGKQNWYNGSWEDWDKMSIEEQRKYDNSSGMGGELSVQTWEDVYNMYKQWISEDKRESYTPEVWSLNFKESLEDLKRQIWIDIDHARYATINWILENLFVIDADGYYQIDPNTGKYLKAITYSEWKKLPKNERS